MNGPAYVLVPSFVPSDEVSNATRFTPPEDLAFDNTCGGLDRLEQPLPENWNAEVAAGKAMAMLSKTARSTCHVEPGSVYAVALAMPQFARTAGYSLKYTGLLIRGYFFLFTNIYIQAFLLYMISKEERVMTKFGGQMHLCDFGAAIQNCPDGPNCIGPGGTVYTSERLYNFNMWATRSFARDSFKALFPDRASDIDAKADPGEYGLESYNLRIISCVIFVIGCWSDLQSSIHIWKILTSVPSYGEPWMSYEVPDWGSGPQHEWARCAKDVHGWTELDLVKFKIAGMPIKWKLITFLFVLVPKLYLWLMLCDVGIVFLLETSAIPDMIINSTALAFILSVDELICSALVSPVTLYMCGKLEPLKLVDFTEEDNLTEAEAYDLHQQDKQYSCCSLDLLCFAFPQRMVFILATTAFFIVKYYLEHCSHTEDGSWISRPLYSPVTDDLSFRAFIFGPFLNFFPVPVSDTAVWEMPLDG